jgi:hypothetical protein
VELIPQSERASHILCVLRNIERERFQLQVEQAGRGVADDVPTTTVQPSPGAISAPTFAERRDELDAQEARVREEFKDLLPQVEALVAREVAAEAEQQAALAAQAQQREAREAQEREQRRPKR